MSARGLVLITAVSTLLFATAPSASASPQYPTMGPAAATCSQETAKQWARRDPQSRLLCTYAPFPPSRFVIVRKGKSLSPHGGDLLQAGDMVVAACTGDQSMRAEVIDAGRPIEMQCGQTPITIDAPGPARPSFWAIIANTVLPIIGRIEGDAFTPRGGVEQSRGSGDGVLRADIFDEVQQMPSNSRVTIPWSGGKAPFTISLQHTKRATMRTVEHEAVIDLSGLPSGTYGVDIADATGGHAGGQIRIRPDIPVPSGNEAAAYASANGDMHAIFYAAWLMRQGAGFDLLAYQQLLPYQTASPEAELIALRLRGDI